MIKRTNKLWLWVVIILLVFTACVTVMRVSEHGSISTQKDYGIDAEMDLNTDTIK